jgi:hypothetical protein
MADLVPHPLVINVSMTLGDGSGGRFQTAVTSLQGAASAASLQPDSDVASAVAAASDEGARRAAEQVATAQNDLAKEFADQASVPGVSLFAGYLGGPVRHDSNDWRLLYLDALLTDWMLILESDIVANERLATQNAPAGVIDVLWVKATSNLVTGSGPRANTGRFLVGELTRAGDFAPSTRGGTFSAASGLLCEATTPGCCRVTRTTCHA